MEITNRNPLNSDKPQNSNDIKHHVTIGGKEFLHHQHDVRSTEDHRYNPVLSVVSLKNRVPFDTTALHDPHSRPMTSRLGDHTGRYQHAHEDSVTEFGNSFDRPGSGLSCVSSELDSGFDDLRSFMVTPTPFPDTEQPETDVKMNTATVNAEAKRNFLDENMNCDKEGEQECDESCHGNRSENHEVSMNSELYHSDDLTGIMDKTNSHSTPERGKADHMTQPDDADLAKSSGPELELLTSRSCVQSDAYSLYRCKPRECIEITGFGGAKNDDEKEEVDKRTCQSSTVEVETNNDDGDKSSSSSPIVLGDKDITMNSSLDLFHISAYSRASTLKNHGGMRECSSDCPYNTTILSETVNKSHDDDVSGTATTFEVFSRSSLPALDTPNDCRIEQSCTDTATALLDKPVTSWYVREARSASSQKNKQIRVSTDTGTDVDTRRTTGSMGSDVGSAYVTVLTSKAEQVVRDWCRSVSNDEKQTIFTGNSSRTGHRNRKRKPTSKRPRDDSPHPVAIHPSTELSIAVSLKDDTYASNGYDIIATTIVNSLDTSRSTSGVVDVRDGLVANRAAPEWIDGQPTKVDSTVCSSVWQPWCISENVFPAIASAIAGDFQLPSAMDLLNSSNIDAAGCDSPNLRSRSSSKVFDDRSQQTYSYSSSPFIDGLHHGGNRSFGANDYLGYGDTSASQPMAMPCNRIWTPRWQSIGRHKSRGLSLLSMSTAPHSAVLHQMSHSELPVQVRDESYLGASEFHRMQSLQPLNTFFRSTDPFPLVQPPQQQQVIYEVITYPSNVHRLDTLSLDYCYSNSAQPNCQFAGNTWQMPSPNFNSGQTVSGLSGLLQLSQPTPFAQSLNDHQRPACHKKSMRLYCTSGSTPLIDAVGCEATTPSRVSSVGERNTHVEQILQSWTERNTERSPYPTLAERRHLAEITGVSTTLITRWFKNYRARLKRKERHQLDGPATKSK